MYELLKTIPIIYLFILIIQPITIFICLILIYKRINRIDCIINELMNNQATQIEQNERIITLLEQTK